MRRSFRVGLISPYNNLSAIGLRQISACLKEAGWNTRMIFLPDPEEWLFTSQPYLYDYASEVFDQVCDLCADVDLVGISVMSNFVRRARTLTEVIQDRLSVPVIWGDIHPTVKPDECLTWADLVCVGEGEEAIVELVNRMATGRGYADIPNIWLKGDAGCGISKPPRPLNRSLDDLPLPDYDLSEQFVLHRGRIVPLTPGLLANYMLHPFAGGLHVVYMTYVARGCPYDCAYCCSSALTQIYSGWRRLRRRGPERVIAEIKAARQLMPNLHAVVFADNTFLATSIEEIQRFSEMYREQVGMPFYVLATPGSVTEEKIRCLVEAGLCDVEMGIQTGSPRTRKLYHRFESNERILAAARCLHQFQKWISQPRYDLISDNPYETQADHLETLRLLYQLPRPFRFWFYSLTFYPGTALYWRAKADGLIQDDERDIYCKNYVQLEPTYYNFVLWCLHRNLPRRLLWFLIQPLAFQVCGSVALRWLFRLLWRGINTWCIWQARRKYLQQASRLAAGRS